MYCSTPLNVKKNNACIQIGIILNKPVSVSERGLVIMMFTQIRVMFTYYRDGRVKTVTNQEAGKSMLTINMRYCTELQPNTEQLNYNTCLTSTRTKAISISSSSVGIHLMV